jgi:hypothetical protein
LIADQVTAQDEKEIDADPAESIEVARCFKAEKCRMIDRDDDDSSGTEKVEPGLALTSSEARVDAGFGNLAGNGWNLAAAPAQSSRAGEAGKPAADAASLSAAGKSFTYS